MATNIVKLDVPEFQGLEKSKADQIKSTFEPMASMLAEFEGQYNEIVAESEREITKELTIKAKRVRLDIGKVRIETGKLKDKQKEYIKLEDRAIMGVHNILVWAVKEKEDNLKAIEDHFEIMEQKRLETIQTERAEKLSKYVEDAFERNLSNMDDDVWAAYFQTKKREHEDRIAAEKKAEEDRIAREKAEAEEREYIRQENERLRKEAEERERIAKIEADKRAKDEAARLAKEAEERRIREAKEKKEREVYEANIRVEQEAKARAEAALRAKEEAEKEAARLREESIQAELSKGDSDKVADLITDLTLLKTKYVFKSKKNRAMYTNVGLLIDKIIGHINY